MSGVPLRVAIAGCGLIGTQWDAAGPALPYALTHAAGFSRQAGATLVAVCDPDLDKARAAAARWGAAGAYADPAAMFAAGPVDLAVVASASAARWDVVQPALAAGVKVLVIEKPLATTLAESRRLVAAIDAAGARTVVNFSRRWDPAMLALRDRILGGAMGPIERLVGTYGKGLTNNGSHMVDLVAFLCDARPLRARALGSPLDPGEADWSQGRDRACDAQLEYEDGGGRRFHLTMLGTDQRAYTCFELRVLGSKALCELTLGGRKLSYTELAADPHYAGYTVPGTPQALPAHALEAMERMAAQALQLAGGTIARANSDVHTALQTALAVEAVRRSAAEDGRWVTLAELDDTQTLMGE
ncbi:MAG TPA: Gfo/Idh/MocA family oxidoreductase [Burkholderiaceae bacterium]|nr:Gfo/Idh/MocA family oxidoreductase [Burkholderiaceae bacterium]